MQYLKPIKKIPKELIYSFLFCLIFFFIESSILKFNYAQFSKLGTKEFTLPLMANLLLSVVSFVFFVIGVWITLLSNRIWRICFYIFSALAIVIEYSCYLTLNHFTTVQEWDLMGVTNEEQKKDMVYILFNFQSLLMIIFTIVFIQLFSIKNNQKSLIKVQFSYIFTILIFYTLSYRYTSNMYITASIYAFVRSSLAFPQYSIINDHYYKTPRLPLKFSAKTNKSSQNIVYIIDESVRGDHTNFYGYDRLVTPKILLDMQQQNKLINWKECVSGTTSSYGSNLLLLTGLKNEDLPDNDMKALTMPTIFQYAKAMGYKTYCIDGQMPIYWNGKISDLNYIDKWYGIDSFNHKGSCYIDSLIAIKIKEIIRDTNSLHFIKVNKLGVHTAYERNYTKQSEQWKPIKDYEKPTGNKNIDSLNRQFLINNYDNALAFNSHIFWNTLINNRGNLDKRTLYLYTSDHGQTLSDNGEFWPHSSNSPKEASVPLWIINKPKQFEIDTNFMPHHSNLFATLLDLMQFPESERTFVYDKSLFNATGKDNKPRKSWHGHLFRKTPSSGRISFE